MARLTWPGDHEWIYATLEYLRAREQALPENRGDATLSTGRDKHLSNEDFASAPYGHPRATAGLNARVGRYRN